MFVYDAAGARTPRRIITYRITIADSGNIALACVFFFAGVRLLLTLPTSCIRERIPYSAEHHRQSFATPTWHGRTGDTSRRGPGYAGTLPT